MGHTYGFQIRTLRRLRSVMLIRRLVMLLAGEDNIREVIAFPKNGRAVDPMSQAPSTVSPLQLFELNIDVTSVEED